MILCSEVGTNRATNNKSPLWPTLFSLLANPILTCDLASAIHSAFDLRRRNTPVFSLFLPMVSSKKKIVAVLLMPSIFVFNQVLRLSVLA